MEFTSRGGNRNALSQPLNVGPPPHRAGVRRKHIDWATRSVRIELFILLLGCALILAALSLFLGFNNNNSASEAGLVKTDRYQAVSLNGGLTSGAVFYSTYFGHITRMTDKYIVLQDVYYLTANQSTQNSQAAPSPQLLKLSCQQLALPDDQMMINRSEVAYWENLQNSGNVVTAINQSIKQNPNASHCPAATGNTPAPASTQSTPASNQP